LHLDDVALGAPCDRISDLRERLNRIEVRVENKKAIVATAMARAEIQRLSGRYVGDLFRCLCFSPKRGVRGR
jgi:hypothetical protein